MEDGEDTDPNLIKWRNKSEQRLPALAKCNVELNIDIN